MKTTQHQVATLISKGLSNKQISRQLFISENTVKYHCKQLFQKYSVNCRTELTFKFLRENILPGVEK
ncbi:response regulator transcription factor [uncultured Vibrio sp.]|uniref:response regulator transcription factor n=1 Tax=Vibrio sp. TaxID=678 RepID=UPI003747EC80